ncbi:TPA: hypothetical protein L0X66_002927 [Citrobacter freundii]|nr:hypothetical protein [Citrobacter freundii]
MPKPDNEEFVVLTRVPKGWGYFCPLRRYSQLVWFTKLHCSCLALGKNNRQRRACATAGLGLSLLIINSYLLAHATLKF